jgi:lipoprotein LprG
VKRRRIGVPLVALVLLLAGCGARPEGPATAQSADLTVANFASTVGEAQQQARTAHIESDILAMGRHVEVSGDVSGVRGDVAFDLTMSGEMMPGDARMILVDQVLYLRVPGLTPGRKFFRLDIDHSDHPAARMLDQLLDQVRRLDPAQAAKAFEAVVELDKVGTGQVDGVETTRYAVTVDTRKALRAMNMDGMVPPGRLPRTMAFDVWLDSDNLMRRLRISVHDVTTTVTFSQWGEPVDITAPPARMTTRMPPMDGMHESAVAAG